MSSGTDQYGLPLDLDMRRVVADPGFTVPDVIGTVEGWRAWKVDERMPPYGNPPKMYSVSHSSYFWAPRRAMRAECERDPDHVPGEDCSCGFYAAKTYEHLREMGYHNYSGEGDHLCVVGRLAMWGKVIEGTQGWKAEWAYPVELFVPFEGWKIGKALSEAYGIPVRLTNVLDRSKSIDGAPTKCNDNDEI